MEKHRRIVRSCLFGLALAAPAAWAGVFDITATVNGQTQSRQYDTAEDALAATTDAGMRALVASYNGTETASLNLDFRGVNMLLAYPTQGSTLLRLDIPVLNLSQTFQGASRDASEDLLKEYFKKNPDLLSRLQRALVETSPVDPVAGNPNSMMSRGAAQDYGLGLVSPSQASGKADKPSGLVGFMPSYTKLVANGVSNPRDMDSDAASLPLSYSRQFETPGRELTIYVPLAQTDVEGAKAYDVGMSLTYRGPISEQWYLAFTGGLRATGSPDLGSGVAMGNATITSSYVIPGKDFSFTIGNMVGFYKALKLKVNDVAYDPDIRNTVFRNGVLIEQNTTMMLGDEPVTWEYALVDTRYTGTRLFNRNQQEVSVTFGSKRAANARTSSMRGGLSYIRAPHAKGFSLSFGFWF